MVSPMTIKAAAGQHLGHFTYGSNGTTYQHLGNLHMAPTSQRANALANLLAANDALT
jgi:hypothetical protein